MPFDARIGRRLRPRDLHILLAILQTGSMAKAASQLAMSQPAVSKAIADMEHLLKVRLLDRSPRGVVPTRYGSALARRGQVVLNELAQGVAELESLADPTVGELRMGSAEPFAAAIAAPIMRQLREQHPGVGFHVVTGDLSTLMAELAARNIEFAMSRLYEGARLDGMIAEVLFDDAYAIVAGAQSRWTTRRKVQLPDLLQEAWVLPPYDSFQGREIAAAFRANGVEPPRPSVATMSLHLRNALLATGRFLTMLPSFPLRLGRSSLRALPVKLERTQLPVGIIRLRDRSITPLGQLFIDRVRALTKPLARAR